MINQDNKLYWPIEKLYSWKKNPRAISEKDFERLKKQIKDLGQYKPLIVTPDGEVLGGNMRLKALQQLDIQRVWVSVIDPKDDEEKLKYALSDNDRAGYYVEDELAELLMAYEGNWLDYQVDLGKSTSVDQLLDSYRPTAEDEFDADKEYEKIATPESKLGEVYKLGNHRLMCGDATNLVDVGKLTGGDLADVVFTDPPYNVDYQYHPNSKKYGKAQIFNDNLKPEDFKKFLGEAFSNLNIATTKDASFYICCAMKSIVQFREALEKTGWYYSQSIIWVKDHFVFAMGQHFHRMFEPLLHGWKKEGKAYFNKKMRDIPDVWGFDLNDLLMELDVWKIPRDKIAVYEHPTQRPIWLCARAILKSSKENDKVIDLFGGSGSTLIACEQVKRICYMIELDPKFCDVIKGRWQRLTGLSPKRII